MTLSSQDQEVLNRLELFFERAFQIEEYNKDSNLSGSRQTTKGQTIKEFKYDYQYCQTAFTSEVSFGKGYIADVLWFAFCAEGQKPQSGIFPEVLFNTKAEKPNHNVEVVYGTSVTGTPLVLWSDSIRTNITNYPESSTKKYKTSRVKKAFTIHSMADFEIYQYDILEALHVVMKDFDEVMQKPAKMSVM
ncbi:MAG: hypothetical protein ACKO37_02985 [Vampirovibrionales bacterium]